MNYDDPDLLLPVANVGRIMKQILPPSAKVSKEAKEIMQECATEFISFVVGEAADKCHQENRKTLNGSDICCALVSLGFNEHAEVIMRYLNKYRVSELHRSNNKGKATTSCIPDQDRDEEPNQTEASSKIEFKFIEYWLNSIQLLTSVFYGSIMSWLCGIKRWLLNRSKQRES